MNGKVSQENMLLRKYIKPAKRKEVQNAEKAEVNQGKGKLVAKGKELMAPHFQVVMLNLSNVQ